MRLANDLGMNVVAEYANRFGIYDKMMPVLAMSLGSGETTVMTSNKAIDSYRKQPPTGQSGLKTTSSASSAGDGGN